MIRQELASGGTDPSGAPEFRRSRETEFMKNLAQQKELYGKFEDLIPMDDPQAVFEEVCRIIMALQAQFDFTALFQVFDDVVRLFAGEYPGYQKCNTRYHDLKHTTDCLLAMARLMHGASVHGLTFSQRDVALGLIAALCHDTGYIQRIDDLEGTGAKYTLIHIDRSIAFMEKYFGDAGFSSRDLEYCKWCVRCTGLEVKIEEMRFESVPHRVLGCMLGTADLLGQMADRSYLERLPFLYREFQEGNVPGFVSEFDLLGKTPAFWEFTKQRLAGALGGVDRYMRDHFRVWWGLDRDLNRDTIEDNIAYLKFILKNHASGYRRYLRRNGLIAISGG